MSSSSVSSVSSLTSHSSFVPKNGMYKSNQMTSKISDSPAAQILLLNKLHDRMKRKRKMRKIKKQLIFVLSYILPALCLLFSIGSLVLYHFLHYRELLIAGTLGLLTTVGCVLQMCFWKRSTPNKFNKADIPFTIEDHQIKIGDGDDLSNFDTSSRVNCGETLEFQLPSKHRLSLKPCLVNGGLESKRASVMITKDSTDDESSKRDFDTRRESKQSVSIHVQPMVLGVDQAQMRRMSIALNKATQELSNCRKREQEGGMLNLARRLTLAGSTFDSDRGFHTGGNNWLGGRTGRGVRRGLAWNESGAGRFFARNYD